MSEENLQNLENTKAQMRKGTLEFSILLVISNGKRMYASDILKELKKIELIVVEGTLYPLLNRLKRANLLSYDWEESENGPPRKYYSVTIEGQAAIKYLGKAWIKLSKSISSLLKYNE